MLEQIRLLSYEVKHTDHRLWYWHKEGTPVERAAAIWVAQTHYMRKSHYVSLVYNQSRSDNARDVALLAALEHPDFRHWAVLWSGRALRANRTRKRTAA